MKFKPLGVPAAIGAVLLVCGCSPEKGGRDYVIPAKVCDVAVEADIVESLLPVGESLEEEREVVGISPGEGEQCSLDIDKKLGLTIKISRQGARWRDALEAADKYSNLKRVSLAGDVESAGVADDGAIVWFRCIPNSGQPFTESPTGVNHQSLVMELFVGDRAKGPDDPEQQHKDIEKFVRYYVPGVEKRWCDS
ncbi:hypothetical protein WBG99_21300 [Streptomyces sp. TG1A-60]|uniref:hypothetical protein n=1 Tax=Streptomyces sp. TG1A-60 TaxID=3129111 RepID=UPI0030CBF72B